MEFETDITGYGRKMGMDARLNDEGRIDAVVKLGGTPGVYNEGLQPAGTVQARTMNPGGSETAGGGGNSGDFAAGTHYYDVVDPEDPEKTITITWKGRADGAIGNPRL